MEQLTTLEASFLEAEDADRHVSMAIGTLAVIDGPVPNPQELAATLSERVRDVPRFTQLVHKHAFDLAAPGWIEDTNFDIGHHVRMVALPPPGDDSALFRLIADLMERRLDRDHPLWECWIIEGLPVGRWAMLVKIHHCLADGIAIVRMITRLADPGTGETYAATSAPPRNRHRPSCCRRDCVVTRGPGPAACGARRWPPPVPPRTPPWGQPNSSPACSRRREGRRCADQSAPCAGTARRGSR